MSISFPRNISLELSQDNELLIDSYIPILKTEIDELINNIEEHKKKTTNLQKVIKKLKRKNFKLSQ
jgi:hypothetical protein